jgi:murein tripeptide amidase MpaA
MVHGTFRAGLFMFYRLVVVSGMLGMFVLVGGSWSEATPTTVQATSSPVVVRLKNLSPSDIRTLSRRGLDLLEMRDGSDLFALMSSAEQASLIAEGWDARLDMQQTSYVQQDARQAFQGGYRTVEETEQFLRDMADRYPDLTRLVDFGDSWEKVQYNGVEGYDLLALHVTNEAITGPKPVFFLMGAIHAREIASAEVATRFISFLLENYGEDAQVSWLLDEHEIVVAPLVNPDGHKLAEQGYLQRKNANDSYGGACNVPPTLSNQYGVDLNRNFSFNWGSVVGPGTNPCSQTFPGESAASEPETQAIQDFLRALYPDHPSPGDTTPAPADTSGVFITLHSYAELVLWPWGYSKEPAPNGVGLERLGKRLGDFNGYYASQAISLYPTSGTTDDWVYATLGIAAYTFEIGPSDGSCGGFMPPYSCLDEAEGGGFWERNLPALRYAASVARAPYTLPAGPEVRDVRVMSDTVAYTMTALVDGRGSDVGAVDIFIGSASTSNNGGAIPLAPVDGVFDAPIEQAQAVVPLERISGAGYDLSEAPVLLLAQAQNAAHMTGTIKANWLPTDAPMGPRVQHITSISDTHTLTLTASLSGTEEPLVAAEMYLGTAPWQQGAPVVLQPLDGAFDSFAEQAQTVLSLERIRAMEGYDEEHQRLLLLVRGQDTAGVWGQSRAGWLMLADGTATDDHLVWLPTVLVSERSPQLQQNESGERHAIRR